MEAEPRGKRTVKKRTIYSPSESMHPDYHLIYVPRLERNFVLKATNVKKISNDQVSLKVLGEEYTGELIMTGSRALCDSEYNSRRSFRKPDTVDYSNSDSDENIALDEASFSRTPFRASQKRRLVFSATPQPRRAKYTHSTRDDAIYMNNQIDESNRSRSEITLNHNTTSDNQLNQRQSAVNDRSLVDTDSENENTLQTKIDHHVDKKMDRLLASLYKKLDFVTKKMQQISQSSGYLESQMSIYRNEKDTFPDRVMFNEINLLEIHAKNPGDYGRRLLRILYTENELKTCMLPSSVSDRYLKPKLNETRFNILNSAMRVKYRIGEHHYQEFYKNLVRKKLGDFLLEEERRARIKSRRVLDQGRTVNDVNREQTIDTVPSQSNIPTLSSISFNQNH